MLLLWRQEPSLNSAKKNIYQYLDLNIYVTFFFILLCDMHVYEFPMSVCIQYTPSMYCISLESKPQLCGHCGVIPIGSRSRYSNDILLFITIICEHLCERLLSRGVSQELSRCLTLAASVAPRR